MPIVIGGTEYVTTGEAVERLAPDVSASTIDNWVRPGPGGAPPRLHPLYGASGARVRLRRQLLYAWPDIVEVERQTRTAAGGRPRQARK